MWQKTLQVCVDSVNSAKKALEGGADELLVCSAASEGGLTPSMALVKQIKAEVAHFQMGKAKAPYKREYIPRQMTKVIVAIKCRTGWDFGYTESEMAVMLEDVNIFNGMGVDGYSFGCLLKSRYIDESKCKRFLDCANPLPVTFNRAFDLVSDPYEALEILIELGFYRVMTSGQGRGATHQESIVLIKTWQDKFDRDIDFVPCGGIDYKNVIKLMNINSKIVHSSCKSVTPYVNVYSDLGMGKNTEHLYETNESSVRALKKLFVSTMKNIRPSRM